MSEIPSVPTGSAENEELKRQVASLRDLTVKLQYSLIAFTWIVGLFLFTQVWRAYKDVNAARPQVSQIVEMARREQAGIEQFAGSLAEFGRTHVDFRPILTKYGIQIPATPVAAPAAPAGTTAAPKPAPAPTQKK